MLLIGSLGKGNKVGAFVGSDNFRQETGEFNKEGRERGKESDIL